jgi:phosphoribosylglycinamide formyltransferase-1
VSPVDAMRVGVLASGAGTNLQALLDELHTPPRARPLPGDRGGVGPQAAPERCVEVVAVASDQPGARAVGRAAAAGVESRIFALDGFESRAARDAALSTWLEKSRVELVVLAGYVALLSPPFVRRWSGRLVNVHPSLLPAFPGLRAIEQAVDYGARVSGVTIHLVDKGVDTGPILMQEAVALPQAGTPDEVHDLLRPIEHRLLCAAVRSFAAGRARPDPGHSRRWLIG